MVVLAITYTKLAAMHWRIHDTDTTIVPQHDTDTTVVPQHWHTTVVPQHDTTVVSQAEDRRRRRTVR